ncbi:MAG TPA: type I restriction-modification system subunit M [bacterium]|mgnify:CR=1 FL=1|nr:type I restriction-modification system subunit M [bacterium]HPN95309.1 type I restriction-modification system subunit M [bacterium]
MAAQTSQTEINDIVWKACDTFRGAVDPSEYKNYILTMLFIKYLSDLWKDMRDAYMKKYKNDTVRVERALSRERFNIPEGCDFDSLYAKRDAANIGEIINTALDEIEDEKTNKAKLENVFRNVDFNSEPALGETKERNRRLKNLLDDFNNPKLDLRPSRIGNADIIGNAYEYLIGKFAAGAGKKGGEFYTPPEVSMLLAKLLQPKPGDKICDPTCGSGSLLIRVAKEIESTYKKKDYFLAGQESNGSTWALCRMNMFLHDMDNARVEWCDTINNPKLIEGNRLMKFNIVVANPPFSLDKWGAENAANDKYNRFWRGIPPKGKGDFAFISHMVEIALEGDGKAGVIVPHGVLFRGGAEGVIRTKLIEENYVEAVIGLPPNLFYGTTIPAAIIIFNKGKKTKDVLFIDASREFEKGSTQNYLRDFDITKIVGTYKAFKSVGKYAKRATFKEIKEADFNLNIPGYVDTFEEEEEIDIAAVQKEINEIESELTATRCEMKKHLRELGF